MHVGQRLVIVGLVLSVVVIVLQQEKREAGWTADIAPVSDEQLKMG